MNVLELAGPVAAAGAGATLELATLAEFYAATTLTADSGAQDILVQAMLDGIHWRVFGRTGGRFVKTQGTAFDHVHSRRPGVRRASMKHLPIVTVTSVENGYMDGDGSFAVTQTLTTDDYFVDKKRGSIVLLVPVSAVYDNEYNLRVVYTAGWTAAPTDLKNAIIGATAQAMNIVTQNRYDVNSIAGGSTQTTYSRLWWRHGTLDTAEFSSALDQVIDAYALGGASYVAV